MSEIKASKLIKLTIEKVRSHVIPECWSDLDFNDIEEVLYLVLIDIYEIKGCDTFSISNDLNLLVAKDSENE